MNMTKPPMGINLYDDGGNKLNNAMDTDDNILAMYDNMANEREIEISEKNINYSENQDDIARPSQFKGVNENNVDDRSKMATNANELDVIHKKNHTLINSSMSDLSDGSEVVKGVGTNANQKAQKVNRRLSYEMQNKIPEEEEKGGANNDSLSNSQRSLSNNPQESRNNQIAKNQEVNVTSANQIRRSSERIVNLMNKGEGGLNRKTSDVQDKFLR